MTDDLFEHDDDEIVAPAVRDDGPIAAPYVMGPRLKAWRAFWDIVPPPMAEAFGVTTSHWLDIESARVPPPTPMVGNYERLAQYMALFDGSPEEHLAQLSAERDADRRTWSKLPKEFWQRVAARRDVDGNLRR